MKVLDRYTVQELFTPILYSLITLVFLLLIADLFDHLDDLLRSDTPLSIIFQYYLSLVPVMAMQILPWAMWFGTLFLLVSFGLHNETLAMKAAGLTITAIVRPILFLGFLLGVANFLVGDRLVPKSYRKAQDLRETYIERKKSPGAEKLLRNLAYYGGGDRSYFFRTYSRIRQEVEGVNIVWFSDAGNAERKKIIAERGRWKDGIWTFDRVTEYQTDSRGQILGDTKTFAQKSYPEIDFSPKELVAAASETQSLSYQELKQSIDRLKENGVRVEEQSVDLHSRLAIPWQGLVMMLVTIPFLAKTGKRKEIAMNILICVTLVFVYHVSGAISLALGKAGKLFPFLAAWAHHMVFALGALLALDKANY
ncbi:MAG: LptF/LptG family permease [Candidatus Omnitrophica bacterium]|nr:LptF/LptG family permease [Candidatus Omnitrophota bacterium]